MGIRDSLAGFAKRASGAFLSTTNVGNVGGGEDDLISTSLPANALEDVGDCVRIRAWGTVANNANAKTLKLYFGATAIASQSLTASQAGRWMIEAIVMRTGSDTQESWALTIESLAALAAGKHAQEVNSALAIDEDAAITVKCTGTGVADNDIVQEGMLVLPETVVRIQQG